MSSSFHSCAVREGSSTARLSHNAGKYFINVSRLMPAESQSTRAVKYCKLAASTVPLSARILPRSGSMAVTCVRMLSALLFQSRSYTTEVLNMFQTIAIENSRTKPTTSE